MSRTDKAMKLLQLPEKQNINAKMYVNTIKKHDNGKVKMFVEYTREKRRKHEMMKMLCSV